MGQTWGASLSSCSPAVLHSDPKPDAEVVAPIALRQRGLPRVKRSFAGLPCPRSFPLPGQCHWLGWRSPTQRSGPRAARRRPQADISAVCSHRCRPPTNSFRRSVMSRAHETASHGAGSYRRFLQGDACFLVHFPPTAPRPWDGMSRNDIAAGDAPPDASTGLDLQGSIFDGSRPQDPSRGGAGRADQRRHLRG
jgi:hypothetical protein